MKRLVASIALLFVIASPAGAYTVTCSALNRTVLSNDPFEQGIAPGYAFGVVDFLAGLQCFVRSPSCDCLQNVVRNDASAFGAASGVEIRACIARGEGNSPAFGAILRAVRQFCPW